MKAETQGEEAMCHQPQRRGLQLWPGDSRGGQKGRGEFSPSFRGTGPADTLVLGF